jgi:hypothetical protein
MKNKNKHPRKPPVRAKKSTTVLDGSCRMFLG